MCAFALVVINVDYRIHNLSCVGQIESRKMADSMPSDFNEDQDSASGSLPCDLQKGYAIEILCLDGKSVPDHFKCPVCHLIFRDPIQRMCGHRFCKNCFEGLPQDSICEKCLEDVSNESDSIDPTISMLISKNEQPYTPDYYLRKELDKHPAQCLYPGCSWKGKFKDYKQQHSRNCEWRPEVCDRCFEGKIPMCEMENHKKDCPYPVDCPLNCGVKISSKLVSNHLLEQLEEHMLILKKNIEKCKNNSGNSEMGCQKFEKNFLKIDKLVGVFQSDLKKLTSTIQPLLSLKEPLLENIPSYDGTFIWKLDDFEKRRKDAVKGTCPSLYSTPFYTSKYGYKMCLRLYLNGDGMGKGKYISLFFVVMRGSYDALLAWPFQQKVSLMMLDQSGTKHVIDSFRPDAKSTSFQRPENKMNIASGCPLFLSLDKLNSPNTYVKSNTAFFKVVVDTTGLERMPVNFTP
ncbi:TNF receptor-associated factor 2 isoform X1 [Octopus bimaculoides]|uniref:TNF receptor-associated factor 2 isoform X1 n=1 Tax=Octopus bimaculoides TaxID=37653 RepID=UPI0022E18467|nr:TNF receptor-associated factor 2 isoform X1 [Octopus bimaculoides]